MFNDNWKMELGAILTYKGFTVEITGLNEAKDAVIRMEALGTEFLDQVQIVELCKIGFYRNDEGKYIYQAKTD